MGTMRSSVGVPGELPAVAAAGATGLQPAEALGLQEHDGYGTARCHRGIASDLDAATDAANCPHYVLDDVGASQRAA